MISIIDYGMGNLRSVQKAFERLGVAAEVVNSATRVSQAERLVLPGVGAFRDAIQELEQQGLTDSIREFVRAERPFLGICLGQQLLFETSYEDGQWSGLGLAAGEVVRFEDQPGLKIPHIGWNQVQVERDCPLMTGIPDGAHFYFVHSYHTVPADEEIVVARTDHGQKFVSMIGQGNMFATQFHPEKSQRIGLQLLQNFAAL